MIKIKKPKTIRGPEKNNSNFSFDGGNRQSSRDVLSKNEIVNMRQYLNSPTELVDRRQFFNQRNMTNSN